MFTTLDIWALVAYLGLITWMGIYFARRNKDFQAYMFGSGNMPWPAIGISLIATSVSATTFLGNPADTYAQNMTYLMCNFGVFLSIGIIAVVFIPRFKRLRVQSAYEILEVRFGRATRLLAATFYCCHLTLRTGILLYGPAIVLSEVFGINIYMAICLTSILAIVYTWFGGLQAVVWTDVAQFFVLLGGGLLTLYFCAQGVGGFGAMLDIANASEKLKWFDGTIDPGNARTFLSAGVVYVVFEVAIRGCDQQFVQRYQACKDVTAANLSSLLSAVLGLVVGLLFYFVGAGLFAYYQDTAHVLPEAISVNHVFPHFILNVLPPGLTGLLVAAIFAAAMSSLDSGITALANTTVKDFHGMPGGVEEDTNQLSLARRYVIVWGIVGTGAAFLCVAGKQSLLSMALFFTSLFTGPLLGLFLLAFFFPKLRQGAVISGAVGGMVTLLLFSNIPIFPEGTWEPIYTFSWPWNPLISLAGTLVVALLADLLHGRRPVVER